MPQNPGTVFTSNLWKAKGGGCGLAVVFMKHGAQCISKQLHDTHCADRAVWIGADYTTPGSSELLSSGIPVFIYKVFRKAADLDAGDDDESIRELFGQAEKCGATVGSLQARPGTQQIEVIPKGTRQLLQSGGINLGSVSTDPMNFSKHSVGLTQTGIDLQHWPAACKLQEQIAANQTTFEIVAVVPQIGTPGTTEQMTKFESSDVRKRVVVQGYSVKGTVRFVGAHAEDGTACVGVELDDAVGKNNGTVKVMRRAIIYLVLYISFILFLDVYLPRSPLRTILLPNAHRQPYEI